MDELQGSLTAYEMRIGKTKPTEKEAPFKAHKKEQAAKCPLANKNEDDSDSYKSKKDYSPLEDEKEEEKSDNEEIETEINLEEELIAALEQLRGRKIKEELELQVIIKTKDCSRIEEEITSLKAQVDKTNQKLKAYEGSIKLNEILNNQRPSHIKFGLGFEKGESSTKQDRSHIEKIQKAIAQPAQSKLVQQSKKHVASKA
ncbi:hypothetical protein MRB53_010413 [Persea americana]|uniref:Uncharacterized protein n=1 Tax=Persea americana TaxID=3435 RepID=A0ACC2LRN7_PERAE|nr:hypothetical protein MRB53_010413 [Persea americana]